MDQSQINMESPPPIIENGVRYEFIMENIEKKKKRLESLAMNDETFIKSMKTMVGENNKDSNQNGKSNKNDQAAAKSESSSTLHKLQQQSSGNWNFEKANDVVNGLAPGGDSNETNSNNIDIDLV